MQRFIQQRFQSGDLTPNSRLDEIKHIGDYLYDRLRRSLAPNRQILTIRMFARRIENMSIDALKSTLQKALQNARNNQCVRTPGQPKYHVPDYNYKGYEAMINLIKVLARNGDGHRLGQRFNFDANRLRMPPKRSEDSRFTPCLTRRTCQGSWRDGLCQPSSQSRGFPGVHGYTGQKKNRRTIFSPRGQHAQSDNVRYSWRKPRRMQKL